MTIYDVIAKRELDKARHFITAMLHANVTARVPYAVPELTVRDQIVMISNCLVGIREINGSNRGVFPDLMSEETKSGRGVAWCVNDVQFILAEVSDLNDKPDLLPYNTAGSQALRIDAGKNGLLVTSYADMKPGDVLIYDDGTDKGTGHACIIAQVAELNGEIVFKTLDGNTSWAPGFNRDGGYHAPKWVSPQREYGDCGAAKRSKRYIPGAISIDRLIEKYWSAA